MARVPREYLHWARRYGRHYGVDPRILLAIGKHETDFGRLGLGRRGLVLGVGAFDSGPTNRWAGARRQFKKGAQILSRMGVHSIHDISAGKARRWATDPAWAQGVVRAYKGLGGISVGGGGGGAGGGGVRAVGDPLSLGVNAPAGVGIAALLAGQQGGQASKPAPQISVPTPPQSYSTGPTLPKGYQSTPTSAPAVQGQQMDDLLKQIQTQPNAAELTGGGVSLVGGGAGVAPGARSPDARNSVGRMVRIADAWDRAKVGYSWGGGHGSAPARPGTPVDCSGFVSAILGVRPRVSGDFERWGSPGRGRQVTVWANKGHVLIQIGHRWYATSHENPGGGAGRRSKPSRAYLSSFVARHPRGL